MNALIDPILSVGLVVMWPERVKRFGVFCLLTGCLGASGCGRQRPAEEPPSPTEARLKQIGSSYNRAATRLNRPPANLAELRPSLPNKPEDLLRSPADGEAFVIVWSVDIRGLPGAGKDAPVIAYEKNGQEGKRHVLRGYSDVVLLSEDELKAAVFPPGYTPSF